MIFTKKRVTSWCQSVSLSLHLVLCTQSRDDKTTQRYVGDGQHFRGYYMCNMHHFVYFRQSLRLVLLILLAQHLLPYTATPPPTPLKLTPSEEMSVTSPQLMSAEIEKSLAESVETTSRVPKRFSGAFPSVEELADIKQKKKVRQVI